MKLQKKCTVLMLAIILSVQTVPVFGSSNPGQSGTTARATTTSSIEDLTVSQATRRATDNSTAIRNTRESVDTAIDNEKKLIDQLFSHEGDPTKISASLMESELQRALALDSISAQRDTLGYIITGQFASIIMAEKALETYDAEIAILERELEITRKKVELGLESHVNYTNASLELEKAKNERANMVNSINDSYRSLNRIMGTPIDRKYNLILDTEYEELGEVDLRRQVDNHRRNSINVKQAQNNRNVAQYRLDNPGSNVDMQTGEILSGPTREDRITEVNKAARAVREAQEAAEDNVLKIYDQIRSLEIAIQSSFLQLERLERDLEILETQLRLGTITALDVEKHKLNIIKLEQSIMTSQLNHNLLVMQFNNPNISA